MKRTVREALRDEVFYPVPEGYVENVITRRQLKGDDEYNIGIETSDGFKGAVADCLASLIQAIGFSEADKSIQPLTDEQRKHILKKANALYGEIGEPLLETGEPKVTMGYGKRRRKRRYC